MTTKKERESKLTFFCNQHFVQPAWVFSHIRTPDFLWIRYQSCITNFHPWLRHPCKFNPWPDRSPTINWTSRLWTPGVLPPPKTWSMANKCMKGNRNIRWTKLFKFCHCTLLALYTVLIRMFDGTVSCVTWGLWIMINSLLVGQFYNTTDMMKQQRLTINFMIYLWNRYTVHLLPIFTYNYHFHKLPGRQQALASPMKSCLLLFHEISSHAVRWNLVMQNHRRVQWVCSRAKNSTI